MKKIFLVVLLMFLASTAYAVDPHHDPEPITVIEEHVTYIDNSIIKKGSASEYGIALAIANAQHHFALGTYSWQAAVGLGRFEENQAISFGVAKRVYSDQLLLSGSLGIENGRKGAGVGLNWRW